MSRRVRLFIQYLLLLLIVSAALVVRWPAARSLCFYNSDTAVLDLMARHMLKGEFRLYYWGQQYYGVLDSCLLAVLFKLWGARPPVSQFLPFLFTGVFLVSLFRVTKKLYGAPTALLSCFYLAFSSPFFTGAIFSTYAYILILTMGLWMFDIALVLEEHPWNYALWIGLGLLVGFSWYYFQLGITFALALLLGWLMATLKGEIKIPSKWRGGLSWKRIWGREDPSREWNKTVILLKGAALGFVLPATLLWFVGELVFYVGTTKVSLFFWPTLKIGLILFAVALSIEHGEFLPDLLVTQDWQRGRRFVGGFLVGYSPAILGAPRWGLPGPPGHPEALPTILHNTKLFFFEILPALAGPSSLGAFQVGRLLFFAIGCGVMGWQVSEFYRGSIDGEASHFPPFFAYLGTVSLLLALFASHLVDVFTARYLLPFYLGVMVTLADSLTRLVRKNRVVGTTLCLISLALAIEGNRPLWSISQSPDPMAVLAQRLQEQGYRGGYAGYWNAYRLTALSGEKLIVALDGQKDRYPPYLAQVRQMPHVFWIVGHSVSVGATVTLRETAYRIAGRETMAGFEVASLLRITP